MLTVRVCDSISGAMAGAGDMLQRLQQCLGPGVRVLPAPCVGRCEAAPVAVVHQRPLPHASVASVQAAAAEALAHDRRWDDPPGGIGREAYEAVMRPGGGFGGLFSIELHGGEAAAEAFYDALEISKGPSLGTNFSLVSPYTLLAHYQELDWAAERGAPRNLIRIWAGLEEPEDLLDRFERALEAVPGRKSP